MTRLHSFVLHCTNFSPLSAVAGCGGGTRGVPTSGSGRSPLIGSLKEMLYPKSALPTSTSYLDSLFVHHIMFLPSISVIVLPFSCFWDSSLPLSLGSRRRRRIILVVVRRGWWWERCVCGFVFASMRGNTIHKYAPKRKLWYYFTIDCKIKVSAY